MPLNVSASSATSAGEVASWDEGNGNSIFTKYYLLGVSGAADMDRSGRVTHGELSSYVVRKVSNEARRLYGR